MTSLRFVLLVVVAIRDAQSDCAAPPEDGDGFMSSGGNAGHGGCSGPPPPGAADDGWVYPGTLPAVEDDIVVSPKNPIAPQHVGHGIDDDAVAAGLGKDERNARDAQFKQWEASMQEQASEDDLDAEERWEKMKHWGLCGGAGVLLALVLNTMKRSGRSAPPLPAAAAGKSTAEKPAEGDKAKAAPKAKATGGAKAKAAASGTASAPQGASKGTPQKKKKKRTRKAD